MAGSVCFDLVFNNFVDGAVGFVDGWFVAGFDVDGPFCFVDEGVVVTAEQGAGVHGGRAAVFPMLAAAKDVVIASRHETAGLQWRVGSATLRRSEQLAPF